jgi:hypothetical protein
MQQVPPGDQMTPENCPHLEISDGPERNVELIDPGLIMNAFCHLLDLDNAHLGWLSIQNVNYFYLQCSIQKIRVVEYELQYAELLHFKNVDKKIARGA